MRARSTLEVSFASAWGHYVDALTIARKSASEKNIHELRVSTQKFEAALSLANGLLEMHETKKLIGDLKNIRKRIGQLRDLQVETKKFQNSKNVKLKFFSTYIHSREKKVKKKSVRCLSEVDLDVQRKSVEKISRMLARFEKKHPSRDIQNLVEKTVRVLYDDFKKTVSEPRKLRLKDIHHSRILVKRLRYQGTILRSVFGSEHLDLKKLKEAQALVGKIQDEHKLQKAMEKFLHKGKNRKQTAVFRFCRRIEKNKHKLIRSKVRNLSMIKWQN